MISPKRIALFGSTGSIGKQCLEIVALHPTLFSVEILTAYNNEDSLIAQALAYNPNIVVIGNISKYPKVKEALSHTQIKVFGGENGIVEAAAIDCYDIMMAAIVGYAGLKPTLEAIKLKKTIALANKETLVVAGEIVMNLAAENKVNILPVDSEHSAIFQCLAGEAINPIEQIILTASGGPFRGKKPNYLQNVRREHALQHPNWSMGAKISIDSATLINKGLEMIEAKWLFNLSPNQIKTVVHPQSIIHSMVIFKDGSIKAQMGLPDMKIPIQYALSYPKRLPNNFPRYNFKQPDTLTFEEPDYKTFTSLSLAIEALEIGGNRPCVLNAANEIAVYAFLKNKIGFLEMGDLISKTLVKIPQIEQPTLENLFDSDAEARSFAAACINL